MITIKNNEKILYSRSFYASQGIKFFKKHPEAYDIFVNNLNKSLKTISLLLMENGILNKGVPYSISTVANLKTFIKDIHKEGNMDKTTSEGYNVRGDDGLMDYPHAERGRPNPREG